MRAAHAVGHEISLSGPARHFRLFKPRSARGFLLFTPPSLFARAAIGGGPRCLGAVRWGFNGQKNSIHCFVDQTNNFTTRADPRPSGRATNPVGSLLDADAPGDDSVFGT